MIEPINNRGFVNKQRLVIVTSGMFLAVRMIIQHDYLFEEHSLKPPPTSSNPIPLILSAHLCPKRIGLIVFHLCIRFAGPLKKAFYIIGAMGFNHSL